MHRTTVYLPDDLREQLARAARADHRSEADLIREGVERVLRERFVRNQPPEPRLPLVDSGHPGLGLAGDWFFADEAAEILDRLVEECTSVEARQLAADGPFFTFQISFAGPGGSDIWQMTTGGPLPRMATQWRHVCWSLDLWRRMVMDGRARPDDFEVLVIASWDPDQPPADGAPAVEIARVKVGPRIGGPQIPHV